MEMTLQMAEDIERIVSFMTEKKSDIDFLYLDIKLFPHQPRGYTQLLFNMLSDVESGLLMQTGPTISKTSKTDYFFKHNSLVELVRQRIKKKEVEDEHQRRIVEKARLDLLLAKRMKSTYWVTFGLAIAGFVMAIVNLLMNLFR